MTDNVSNSSSDRFAENGGQVLRDDEENFVDHSTRVALIVEERSFIR